MRRTCCALLCLAAMLAPPLPAIAATVWVTHAGDEPDPACPSDDRCTLRGAVAVAASGDEIRLAPSLGDHVEIELLSPLVMDRAIVLSVRGPGSDRLAIRPTGLFRVIVFEAGTTTLADLTLRDGAVIGAPGLAGSTPGAHGSHGGAVMGGCALLTGSAEVFLLRVALRQCTALGGDGGNGASGLRQDRGAGGAGGNGGQGGEASGAAIAVFGNAKLDLRQSSISESMAIGGHGGNGGRGGSGSLAGGPGGAGGRGGSAAGGGLLVYSLLPPNADALFALNVSLLGNGLGGGNGGAGGAGGQSTGAGPVGAAGQNGPAGDLSGGNLFHSPQAAGRMTLFHATLGPAMLERGVPGNWDGASAAGRSLVTGEVLWAGAWRVAATVIVGASSFPPCAGAPPEAWMFSGTSAASDPGCLQEPLIVADASDFLGSMALRFEHGRATARPAHRSALVDSLVTCGANFDQSGRPRPLEGNGDDAAACDIGALEVAYSTTIFADGFGD